MRDLNKIDDFMDKLEDFNDKELEEAIDFIKNKLKDRQRKKIDEALLKVKEALDALKKECGDIELFFDGYYSFDVLYAEIEAEVK